MIAQPKIFQNTSEDTAKPIQRLCYEHVDGTKVYAGTDKVYMQVIIEKAYEGIRKDHVKDALDLFVDFMAIFVSPPVAPHEPAPDAHTRLHASVLCCRILMFAAAGRRESLAALHVLLCEG